MQRLPPPLLRIQQKLLAEHGKIDVTVVPVIVLWSRMGAKEGSVLRATLSDQWRITANLRRFVGIFFYPTDIVIGFGRCINWSRLLDPARSENWNARRLAVPIRVEFHRLRHQVLGPTVPHRNRQIDRIAKQVANHPSIKAAPSEQDVRLTTRELASRMAYPTTRFLRLVFGPMLRLLTDELTVTGLARLEAIAKTHTLVYVPNHRSHLDYILISYLLFQHGFHIPYIAAGDNLDLPIVGGMLRRAGAFFIRRSFDGDETYKQVISDYVYDVLQEGHSLEVFVEGGRSRPGWMREPRAGFLEIILAAHARGIEKPLAFVPLNINYEKLVEKSSYAIELQSNQKQTETVVGLVKNIGRLPRRLGAIRLSFGDVITVPRSEQDPTRRFESALDFAERITRHINAASHINAVNLFALAVRNLPHHEIAVGDIENRIMSLQSLFELVSSISTCTYARQPPSEIMSHVMDLCSIEFVERHASTNDYVALAERCADELRWHGNAVLHCVIGPFLAISVMNQEIERTEAEFIESIRARAAIATSILKFELSDAESRSWYRGLNDNDELLLRSSRLFETLLRDFTAALNLGIATYYDHSSNDVADLEKFLQDIRINAEAQRVELRPEYNDSFFKSLHRSIQRYIDPMPQEEAASWLSRTRF